uniref:Uncharacterized protein n=1 Tax=Lactuca sativa TaxID=4236 RepID=A0A9R1UNF6_LACSA|nr:hypothetical protein LSAT_V11C800391040 [Lactuca sativa]
MHVDLDDEISGLRKQVRQLKIIIVEQMFKLDIIVALQGASEIESRLNSKMTLIISWYVSLCGQDPQPYSRSQIYNNSQDPEHITGS